MDVAHGEIVEAELNRLIEKRAALEDPEANEELWQQSVRRYNARRRKELDLQRYEYHRGQAARLKAVLESLIKEHEQNVEKHLP
jgi:hypothetical protein